MNTVARKVIRIDRATDIEKATETADFAAALSPAERQAAKAFARDVVASAVKGALHAIDPARYPVDAAAGDADAQIARAMAALPVKAAQRIRPRVVAIGDGTRMPALLKGMDVETLRKARPVLKPIERDAIVRPMIKVTDRDADPPSVPAPARYTKAILELRAIHCVQETGGGGADEIVFGGVLIGATGNTNQIDAFDAGDFDSGTYADFGAKPIGRYSLKVIEGYPSHLYAIFMLIESDSDDQEVANSLTTTISIIAVTAAAYFSGGLAAGAAYAVFEAIGGLIDSFFGPDALRHYGIRLTLNSNDPFGSAIGPKMRTGDITGEGAVYRVGYRWVMSA
jgi:hypothetical protein